MHIAFHITMSWAVVFSFTTVISVMSQSTLLDTPCGMNYEHDVEIQNMIEQMKVMNMRSERQKADLKSKIDELKADISKLRYEMRGTIAWNIASKDCDDIRTLGHSNSGVYGVNGGNGMFKRIYCEIPRLEGSSTLTRIMNNQDNLTDFTYSKWADYESGFGDPHGSHWMGLQQIHELTTRRDYKLRVDITDWEGQTRYAEYSTFRVGPASDNYRLAIGGYSGTATDSMIETHNNMMFTTIDQDNDHLPEGNCANGTAPWTGGWWHKNCFTARLTGQYIEFGTDVPSFHGIQWRNWPRHQSASIKYSYKVATMSISRL